MTALWIFLGITALNGVLLACPVRIRAEFTESLSGQIGFLFFRFSFPAPAKKKRRKKAGKETGEGKKREKPDILTLIRKKGLSGFLGILGEMARLAAGTAKRLFARTCVDTFDLDLAVCGSDAAQTAVNFGAVCSVVYSAAGALQSCMRFRGRSVNIVPDYNGEKSRVRFRVRAHVRLLFLLSSLLWALMHSGGLLKDLGIKTVKS